MAGIDIFHAAQLDEEGAASVEHLCQVEATVLDELEVEIQLVVDGSLHIVTRAIHGDEVHVEQCLCLGNGEDACRDAVLAEVHHLFGVEVASAGNDE